MIERIRQLMDYKNLSASQFADEVEVPRAVLSHILSGRNKPSLDVMLKIIQAHPDISMNWLLLGEGEMLNTLAATAKPSAASPEPERKAAKAKPGDTEAAEPVEQSQQVKAAQTPAAIQKKVVEQVIIFYTDKTFSVYTSAS
ncbi:helix-turn-helix domain-containing protein [Pontibacter sp. 172403-2]|uniref:helix-turn-helix domain-containing protein n=1 Tax=Pontibacter rufus TaxID=2791028 RepID=UPI0018AFF0F4|nr:helix-turn-helix transcriptional regulator [Pontibacter sp. 172403-2]MBF9255555.1 helix-turn-helix domain-containing protein [Pontibacter sp. 172403-2]